MPVGETLTSIYITAYLNSGSQINVRAGIMTCQGTESGWNHFSSIYGKPCMFKVCKTFSYQEYFYNKQLCKSACLNMYMKFPANGSPRGRASSSGNFVSTPNPPCTCSLNCRRNFNLLFKVFIFRNSGYTPTGTSIRLECLPYQMQSLP